MHEHAGSRTCMSNKRCACSSEVACARGTFRCGNVAAILELDEHLEKNFKVSIRVGAEKLHLCT